MSDNMLHDWERFESRAAQAVSRGATCGDGNHQYVANVHGGGTCRHCGGTIGADEL